MRLALTFAALAVLTAAALHLAAALVAGLR